MHYGLPRFHHLSPSLQAVEINRNIDTYGGNITLSFFFTYIVFNLGIQSFWCDFQNTIYFQIELSLNSTISDI